MTEHVIRQSRKFQEATRRHRRYKRLLDRSRKFRDHGAMSDRPFSQTVLGNSEKLQRAKKNRKKHCSWTELRNSEVTRRHKRYKRLFDKSRKSRDHGAMSD